MALSAKPNEWLRLNMSRKQAERALMDTSPGTFVIRNSSQYGYFALTVRMPSSASKDVHSVLIQSKMTPNATSYALQKSSRQFKSLEKLVEYYSNHLDDSKQVAVKLKSEYTLIENQIDSSHIGARVAVEGYEGEGTLVFFGNHVQSNTLRAGVRLDKPVGKNNGIVNNHKYFRCDPRHGVLCTPAKVSLVDPEAPTTSTGDQEDFEGFGGDGEFEVDSAFFAADDASAAEDAHKPGTDMRHEERVSNPQPPTKAASTVDVASAKITPATPHTTSEFVTWRDSDDHDASITDLLVLLDVFGQHANKSDVDQLFNQLVKAMGTVAKRHNSTDFVRRRCSQFANDIDNMIYKHADSQKRARMQAMVEAEKAKAALGPMYLQFRVDAKAKDDAATAVKKVKEAKSELGFISKAEYVLEQAESRLNKSQTRLDEAVAMFDKVRLGVAQLASGQLVQDKRAYDTAVAGMQDAAIDRMVVACEKMSNKGPLKQGDIVKVAISGTFCRAKVVAVQPNQDVNVMVASEKRLLRQAYVAEAFETHREVPRHQLYTDKPPQLLQQAPTNNSDTPSTRLWLMDNLRTQADKALPVFVSRVETLIHKGTPALQHGTRMVVGPLKKLERSWEKVFGKYGGNVQALLDVCRMTVVCDTAEMLAELTELLEANPEILDCCRVKMRLHPCYDTTESGGYRDILINVRIPVGDDDLRHLCELQLTIKPILEIKNSGAHTMYGLARVVGLLDPAVHTLNGNVEEPTTLARVTAGLITKIDCEGGAVAQARLVSSLGSKHCHLVQLKLYKCRSSLAGMAIPNLLTPAVLSQLANTLRVLNLNYCGMTGRLDGKVGDVLAKLTSLTELRLAGNQLVGSIPADRFACFIHLEIVQLNENELSGSLPPDTFGKMTNLRELKLFKNKLTGAIPRDLGNCINMEDLELYKNELSGSLPPDTFGKMTNLRELKLFENKLTGAIPRDLGNCINMEKLILSINELSGRLPPDMFGKMTNLKVVLLFENKLTGAIPRDLGNCINMEKLNLRENELSGRLPPGTFGKMTNLKMLRLGGNKFTGVIPSDR